MRGAYDFDVELQLVLESREGSIERILLGDEQDIGIDCAFSPAKQDRGGAAREVDGYLGRAP
jgi:hypothetical protein